MKQEFRAFIKSHNLVNRIYDMALYYHLIKNNDNEKEIKTEMQSIKNDMNIEYVESLAQYFDKKLQRHPKNIDLRCNLIDLVYDLDYLKQYLCEK